MIPSLLRVGVPGCRWMTWPSPFNPISRRVRPESSNSMRRLARSDVSIHVWNPGTDVSSNRTILFIRQECHHQAHYRNGLRLRCQFTKHTNWRGSPPWQFVPGTAGSYGASYGASLLNTQISEPRVIQFLPGTGRGRPPTLQRRRMVEGAGTAPSPLFLPARWEAQPLSSSPRSRRTWRATLG